MRLQACLSAEPAQHLAWIEPSCLLHVRLPFAGLRRIVDIFDAAMLPRRRCMTPLTSVLNTAYALFINRAKAVEIPSTCPRMRCNRGTGDPLHEGRSARSILIVLFWLLDHHLRGPPNTSGFPDCLSRTTPMWRMSQRQAWADQHLQKRHATLNGFERPP